MSWLVQRDVDNGRHELNFSEWPNGGDQDDLHEPVEEGEMPPSKYLLLHPDAKLSSAEKARLIAALRALGDGAENRSRGRRRGRD
jgi:hypothetical protein